MGYRDPQRSVTCRKSQSKSPDADQEGFRAPQCREEGPHRDSEDTEPVSKSVKDTALISDRDGSSQPLGRPETRMGDSVFGWTFPNPPGNPSGHEYRPRGEPDRNMYVHRGGRYCIVDNVSGSRMSQMTLALEHTAFDEKLALLRLVPTETRPASGGWFFFPAPVLANLIPLCTERERSIPAPGASSVHYPEGSGEMPCQRRSKSYAIRGGLQQLLTGVSDTVFGAVLGEKVEFRETRHWTTVSSGDWCQPLRGSVGERSVLQTGSYCMWVGPKTRESDVSQGPYDTGVAPDQLPPVRALRGFWQFDPGTPLYNSSDGRSTRGSDILARGTDMSKQVTT